ncbi:MAG TPA: hypothetical protein VH436_31310, partial [Vicinamibacterales bacterium]
MKGSAKWFVAEGAEEVKGASSMFFDGQYAQLGRDSNTFGHAMTFDEQRMVPQTKQYGDIK